MDKPKTIQPTPSSLSDPFFKGWAKPGEDPYVVLTIGQAKDTN